MEGSYENWVSSSYTKQYLGTCSSTNTWKSSKQKKWVFKTKFKLDKYKVREVAKGFQQTGSLDFNETFNPIVKPITIKLVITITISKNWSIWQLYVNTVFLNGDTQEDVYMV